MSEGLNEVRLFGNIGADPELKTGKSSVLKLRVATTERFKDKEGVWQDRSEWHNVTVFGPRAEGLSKVLAKGRQILVLGSLRTTSYEAKDGTKKYSTEVVANNIILGAGGRGAGTSSGSPPSHEISQADDDAEFPF